VFGQSYHIIMFCSKLAMTICRTVEEFFCLLLTLEACNFHLKLNKNYIFLL
jgi:hypothetical protein